MVPGTDRISLRPYPAKAGSEPLKSARARGRRLAKPTKVRPSLAPPTLELPRVIPFWSVRGLISAGRPSDREAQNCFQGHSPSLGV